MQNKGADYSCSDNGNCNATINAKEDERVDWSVRSVCTVNDATIYSPELKGKETTIPYCRLTAANNDESNNYFILHAFFRFYKHQIEVYANRENLYELLVQFRGSASKKTRALFRNLRYSKGSHLSCFL